MFANDILQNVINHINAVFFFLLSTVCLSVFKNVYGALIEGCKEGLRRVQVSWLKGMLYCVRNIRNQQNTITPLLAMTDNDS